MEVELTLVVALGEGVVVQGTPGGSWKVPFLDLGAGYMDESVRNHQAVHILSVHFSVWMLLFHLNTMFVFS